LPKNQKSLHVLFISSILSFEPKKRYPKEVLNTKLEEWPKLFGNNFGLDYVTLRRYLIDARYLTRDTAGEYYELGAASLPYTFDQSLRELDLEELVREEKGARELKKQQYLKKAGK